MSLVISTDRLISSSEARKKFGRLLDDVSSDSETYYVILENGKIVALLVNPLWLEERQMKRDEFPEVEDLRIGWQRYSFKISDALRTLHKKDKSQLPKLLQ